MNKKIETRTHLTTNELAARLNCHPVTVAKWRVQGIGPKYIKNGEKNSKVLYAISEVEAWEKAQTIQSTAQS